MTTAELTARAADRARTEHVQIRAIAGRPGFYTTRSKTNRAEHYTLVDIDGGQACTCKGFEYRKSCKHVEALRNRLAREAVKAARSAAVLPTEEPEPPIPTHPAGPSARRACVCGLYEVEPGGCPHMPAAA